MSTEKSQVKLCKGVGGDRSEPCFNLCISQQAPLPIQIQFSFSYHIDLFLPCQYCQPHTDFHYPCTALPQFDNKHLKGLDK